MKKKRTSIVEALRQSRAAEANRIISRTGVGDITTSYAARNDARGVDPKY